ncbi:MAG: capsule assembly Wzi family protein [Pseudomonadota bacterium]
MISRRLIAWPVVALLLVTGASALAGPYLPAGDHRLRQDVQVLADAHIFKGTTTTWPIAWGPLLEDIREADLSNAGRRELNAIARIRSRARWETAVDTVRFDALVAVSENPQQIRTYGHAPRGTAEIGGGVSWLSNAVSIELNAQYIDTDDDEPEFRMDQSRIGVIAGNWAISLDTMDRFWGPGLDSSLILSNNARPFPALVIDRVFNEPFESRFLRWLGPWDLNVMFGELEEDRVIPNAGFFGMRVNFRPTPGLEIGLTRTAQWCGDGRPCDLSTFGKLLIGKDNRGGSGINADNEPGNQLAGFDFRWTPAFLDRDVAVYGQFIGEDEAGGFPSRWLGQFGAEWNGYVLDDYHARIYAEFAGTASQFYESSEFFDYAYEHGIYRTGYRYRDAAIGHALDNDARVVTLGVSVIDRNDADWQVTARMGELNRGGVTQFNTVALEPTDLASIDIVHRREFWFGVVEAAIGTERREVVQTGSRETDARFFLQWRSSY